MAIVSDIEIRLRADIARLQQDMTRARQSVSSFTSDAKKLLMGFAAGFSLKALATEVINAQREFDKLNSSLYTATGSAASAAGAFKALQAFAASTPYSVAEATEAFIKLRNLGLTPSERALGSYGNTAAAMGKGLNQMIEAVADAATGEFERLKEFGIKAKQNGDQVLFTFQGVTKSIGNNAKDIEKYLMRIGEVDFAGAMERRANTLDGAISNLGDTWSSVMRAISSNGFGEGVMAGVLALSGALTDLSAIIDAVGGAASKEGEQMKEAAGLHKALTTVFEAVAVLGLNVAYVFTEVGKELGGLAAQAAAVAHGDFAGAKAIGVAMRAEAEADRAAVDAKSAAILGAADKAADAREKEAEGIKKSGADRLAGYAKELSAEEKRNQATLAIIDIRNKLNGVDKDTVGNLAKLKTALDTGAISQVEYNKYTAQIAKETTEASTAYKNQIKALDLSTDAIKRRADAQAFANQQDMEHLAFLNRSGQLNDTDFTAQKGAAELKSIEDNKAALQAQLVLEKQRLDNKAKVADLNGQIAAADKAIDAKKLRNDEAQFELEQKQYREALAHTADLTEAAQAETKAQQDRTRDQQDEMQALGLTGNALAQLTAARLRDQAVALDKRAELAVIAEVSDAYRAQAEELRKQADIAINREQVQKVQAFWSSVEQTAHDTFVSIGDGGEGMWKRLRDSGKNIFFEWLYQMTVKKWIINVGASFDGSAATAGISNAMGGSSGGGTSGTPSQAVTALYNTFKSGGTMETSIASGMQSVFDKLGLSMSGGAPGEAAQWVGKAGGTVAGYMAGSALNSAISGKYETGSGFMATEKIATAVASYFSPIAGAIVGAISGLVNRAFGMGPKEIKAHGLAGSLSATQVSGSSYEDWHQDGGWFRSDKNGKDTTAFTADMVEQFKDGLIAIEAASAGFASALGVKADWITEYSKEFDIALTGDAAKDQQAIADFFNGVGDELANKLVPNLAEFQQKGETASATLQRLATDFQGVDVVMAALGTDSQTMFGAVGIASAAARERLLKFAGGLDALATQTTFYTQNFLTEADRAMVLQKPVADTMAALGFAGVTTTEQFKAAVDGLVKSGAVATEEGAKQYAGLMALAPQFKTVADYLKEVSDTAAQTVRDLAEAQAQAVQSNQDMLRAVVDGSMAALGRAVDAEKDRVQAALEDTLRGLDTSIARVNDTIARTGDLSKALKGAIAAPAGVDNAGRTEVARAEITAALAIAKASGVLPTAESIADALGAVTQDSSDNFATLADYQRATARTNAELEALGGMSDSQLDTAQRQLQMLQAQKDAAQASADAELQRLDGLLAGAQAQLDAINGTNNSVLSLGVAMAAIQVALGALKSAPTATSPGMTGSGTTTVEDLYRQVLGRAPDAVGYEFWKNAYGDVVDQAEYLDFVKAAQPELQGLVKAPPEVATYSTATADSSAVVAELQTLNSRMVSLEASMSSTANSTGQFASQFNSVSGGGNSLIVEPS